MKKNSPFSHARRVEEKAGFDSHGCTGPVISAWQTGVVRQLAVGLACLLLAPGLLDRAAAQSIYTPYAFTNFVGLPGSKSWVDGTGSDGRLDSPHGVAVDAGGNVFVADTFNHVIRRVTPAGVMTTIAGSPKNFGYVDGVGFAEAAKFFSPIGIGADAAGNLFVADNGNQTIRKVTPAGVVTLYAGQVGVKGNANGAALSATFNSPHSTAVDSAGNVFVSDGVNRVIRKITPAGVVSLFAGAFNLQGTNDGVGNLARFQQPMGLAVDQFDNLFVADQNANTIRKITPGGAVTTVAGKGRSSGSVDGTGEAARFTGPEGVTVDLNGVLYVTDTGNHTLRRITPGGVVSTIVGVAGQRGEVDGTNDVARLRTPRGITRDGAGNLYFADSVNSAIRKVVIDGANFVVTTLAGTMGENGSVDATGSDARFHFPHGLACDADGNIFAIDRSNECVRKITPEGVVTTLAGVPGFQGSDDGAGAAAQFYQPQELALDGDGNIYVVEHANNTVRKIAPVGPNWVVTTLAGCPTCPEGTNDGAGILARFGGPFGLTFSGGNVFVADTGNKTIRKLTPSVAGWEVTTFAGLPGVGGNQDGAGTAARFSAPLGLARDSAGNLYVGDSAWIRRITPDGTVSTLAGQFVNGSADGPGSTASFWSARGVAVDQAGNIYVADQSNQLIRKLTSGGGGWNVTTIGGTPGAAGSADGVGPDARFSQPIGVAVDAAGNVYVADSFGARVTKGVSGEGPVVVRFDAGAGMLVVAGGNLTLRLLTPASGSIVLEESPNLLDWLPIRTNLLTAPTLDLVIPFKPGTNGFFRLIFTP